MLPQEAVFFENMKTSFWKQIGRRKSLVRCGVAVGRVGDVGGSVKTQRLL